MPDGADVLAPTRIPGLSDVRAVSMGASHACALRANGTVVCWGLNNDGEAGVGVAEATGHEPGGLVVRDDGSTLTGVLEIAAGGTHTCARTANELLCWGSNNAGQLGFSQAEVPSAPFALPLTLPWPGARLVALSTSYQSTCAVEAEGRVACWGRNEEGQAGIGSASPEPVTSPMPVEAAPPASAVRFTDVTSAWNHQCALGEDGQVYCFGQSSFGQLGLFPRPVGIVPRLSSPARSLGGVVEIEGGSVFTCARTGGGAVTCWGTGSSLGNGSIQADEPGTPVALNDAVVSLGDVDGASVCVRTARDEVWCWGDNTHGQLCDGTRSEARLPVRALGFPAE